MTAIDYLPCLLAFLAVIFGIVGKPKWDDKERGLKRLTPTGRVTLALGIAALIGSVAIVWRNHRANDFQSLQRSKIRSVAHAELRLALRQIVGPWFILFGDDSDLTELDIVPAHVEDPERLAKLVRSDAASTDGPFGGLGGARWNYVLKHNADLGSAKIDRVLQIYSNYLEPDVLECISELRTSELLWRLQDSDTMSHFPFPDPTGEIHPKGMFEDEYKKFWRAMRTVDSLLEKDTSRLKRRI